MVVVVADVADVVVVPIVGVSCCVRGLGRRVDVVLKVVVCGLPRQRWEKAAKCLNPSPPSAQEPR